MSRSLDRLTLLETFTRIAERGSISAAARDLGLSQPSVSRQLSELEQRLGSQLVHRTTHALALTTAGQELLHDARDLIDGWEALTERHGRGQSVIAGRLKVVVPIALGQRHLTDVMLRFQAKHRGVSVAWELDDDPIRFAEEGCDCWIKVGPVPDDALIVRPLAKVERLLVAAPPLMEEYTVLSPDDVAELPFAALDPFEGGRIALNSGKEEARTVQPKVVLSTNNIVALHRAVLAGAGAAIMPRWLVEADLKAGRLVDVVPGWRAAMLAVNIAYLPGRHRSLRLTKFIEHVSDEIERIPGLVPAAGG